MNITVQIDPNLTEMIQSLKRVDRAVKDTAWEKTLELALAEEKRIKEEMPVDTGRAKASWGHFTPDDLVKGSERIGKGKKITKRTKFQAGPGSVSERTQIATAGDAIWIEDKSNLSVEQGTEVPYTQYLNEGHSGQAPAGFIDAAEEWANNQIGKFSESVFDIVVKVLWARDKL